MRKPSGEPPWLNLAYNLSTGCNLGELRSEIVPTEDACLRVVAQDVHAPEPVPRVPYALCSGYAVRAAETRRATAATPVALQRRTEFRAYVANNGDPAARALRPGECESIPAGIPLPENADAVLPYIEEETDELNPPPVFEEQIVAPVCEAANVQRCGEDYERGATLVARGTRITAQLQAVLIAAGVLVLPVYKRPRIGVVLSSYDTVPPSDAIHPWQRRDATSAYIRSVFARWGYTVPPTEQIAPVNPFAPRAHGDAYATYRRRLLRLMSNYDLLIGVGMPADPTFLRLGVGGPFSFPVPARLIDFDRSRNGHFKLGVGDDRTPPIFGKRPIYRAGSTTEIGGCEGFAYYDRAIVLNLPGYTPEVAAYMHTAVRYIIDLMEGVQDPGPVWRKGELAHPLKRHPKRHRFLWGNAHLDEGSRVTLRAKDDQSGLHLSTFVASNALVALQFGTDQADAGESIDYVLLD